MKTFLALFPFLVPIASAQGPLLPSTAIDPKVGPIAPLNGSSVPQPVMKTLHQVEPRTPLVSGSPGVTVSGSTISINASGSYYLTGNLAVGSGSNGIVINASGVTVDLCGFTISSTSSPAAGTGVQSNSNQVNLLNGNILSSGVISAAGTFSGQGFLNCVSLGGNQTRISGLNVSGASNYGIRSGISSSSVVEGCTVNHCVLGIEANLITRCAVSDIGTTGLRSYNVSDSTARSTAGIAIYADIVNNSNGTTMGTTSGGIGIFAPGMVSHSYGGSGGGTSSSISSALAIGCSVSGTAQITNKYNMP